MNKLCVFIKWISLPLFMPVYALLLVLYVPVVSDFRTNFPLLFDYKPQNKISLIVIFFIFGAVMPALSYSIMSRFGMISSIEMKNQTERRGPIFLMFVYCMALFSLFFFQSDYGRLISPFLLGMPLSGACVSIVIFIINFKTKISLHGSGVGIFSGFLCAYAVVVSNFPIWPVYLAFIISGIVLYSRLYLKAHTPLQVYLGYSIGFLLTFIINFSLAS